MARIVGVDLPKNKRGEIGLTYIYGIGRSTARQILDKAGISYPSPSGPPRPRSEHEEQRPHAQRSQEDCRKQEKGNEVIIESYGKENWNS